MSVRGRLIALAGVGARVQQRPMLRAEAALVADAVESGLGAPAAAIPRLQTVESKVEWRS
jgi:hypothetical protein